MRILFSNIGYAKDINGTLWQHIRRFGRHVYSSQMVQEQALSQFKTIINQERPDLCCLVEIDQGSFHSNYFNQIQALMDDEYQFHDIANKYGANSRVGRMPLHKGKSNAFLARQELPFERLYFSHGSKRLIYRILLPNDIQLFFAHFSLQRKVRYKQFQEIRKIIHADPKPAIILADFNIMQGFSELSPLLNETDLCVLNKEDEHTFRFHRRHLTLDLCICSQGVGERAKLRIIPQPFSDHAALLLEI